MDNMTKDHGFIVSKLAKENMANIANITKQLESENKTNESAKYLKFFEKLIQWVVSNKGFSC